MRAAVDVPFMGLATEADAGELTTDLLGPLTKPPPRPCERLVEGPRPAGVGCDGPALRESGLVLALLLPKPSRLSHLLLSRRSLLLLAFTLGSRSLVCVLLARLTTPR